MRVALFGGTGFVGSYLVDALLAAGMQPVLLVREGHEDRVRHAARCKIVTGDIGDTAAVNSVLSEADAAIYNIGILREFPRRGVTFEDLQYKGATRVIDAAALLGVKRLLLMSANGVKANGTAYQTTKFRAEQHLAGSGLDWTVFRPSVIFGDPRGRSEFATQLLRDIIESPIPAPLFYDGLLPPSTDQIQLSPVHVGDVADAFVRALRDDATIGKVIALGGADTVSWRQALARIAAVAGRRKAMVPVPAFGISTAASLFERFAAFPITRDQLSMLLEGNRCGVQGLQQLGISARAFTAQNLGYLVKRTKDSGTWQRHAA